MDFEGHLEGGHLSGVCVLSVCVLSDTSTLATLFLLIKSILLLF